MLFFYLLTPRRSWSYYEYYETLKWQEIFLEKTPDSWACNLPFRKEGSLHILYVFSLYLDIFSGERTKRLLFVCLVMNKSKSRALITCTVRQRFQVHRLCRVCGHRLLKKPSAGYQETTYSCASFSVELRTCFEIDISNGTAPPSSANLV